MNGDIPDYACYLVRCDRGREEEIAREVIKRASHFSMSGFFKEAIPLSRKVIEIQQGVKRSVPPRYAGLIGINMIMNTPSHWCVMETSGVKEIVNEAPLPDNEINRLIAEEFESQGMG